MAKILGDMVMVKGKGSLIHSNPLDFFSAVKGLIVFMSCSAGLLSHYTVRAKC